MPAKTWSDFYAEASAAGTDDASARHSADEAMAAIAEALMRTRATPLPGGDKINTDSNPT